MDAHQLAGRVLLMNDGREKGREVQPLVGRISEQAIIKVVSVNKEDCFQTALTKPIPRNEKTGLRRFFHPNGQRTESLRTGLSSEPIVGQQNLCMKYRLIINLWFFIPLAISVRVGASIDLAQGFQVHHDFLCQSL